MEYSLLRRSAEGDTFGVARELSVGITPWSPLAGGVLSRRYSRADTSPWDFTRGAHVDRHLNEHTFAVLDVPRGRPRGRDHRGRDGPGLGTASSGGHDADHRGRTLGQVAANLASLDVTLSDAQLTTLNDLNAPELDYPYNLQDETAAWMQGGTSINGITARAPLTPDPAARRVLIVPRPGTRRGNPSR